MNILLIGAILFLGFAVVYKLFFKGNNSEIYAEMYELNAGHLIRMNPKKQTKCLIKKQDNTFKLFLPKKYTNNIVQGIEIPKSSDYILNYHNIRLIKVIKLNENEFKLAKPELNVSKDEYSLKYKPIERDVSFWSDNEQLRINHEYNNDSMWDKIKPYVTLGLVAIVCMIMIISTLEKVGEIADEAKKDKRDMVTLIGKLMDNPGSVANELQKVRNEDKEVIDTDSAKPPGNE